MSYMEWGDTLSVGVAKLDEQHKRLVNMVNELHDAMENERSHEAMAKIIRSLVLYTQTHFKLEEDLMTRYGDPEVELHKKQHEVFTQKLLVFQKEYDANIAKLDEHLFGFLTSWLVNHIQKIDIRYAPILADKC